MAKRKPPHLCGGGCHTLTVQGIAVSMNEHRAEQLIRAGDFVRRHMGKDAPAILADREGDKLVYYINRNLNGYVQTKSGIYIRETPFFQITEDDPQLPPMDSFARI